MLGVFALGGLGVQLIWALTPVSQVIHVQYVPSEPAGDATQEHLGDALTVVSAVEEDQPIGQVGN